MGAAPVIRSLLHAALVVCGAHFLLRAATGQGLVARAKRLLERARERPPATPPAAPPVDPVDEASWESFPASDPPAISRKEPRPPES
jgi:hypothetical protein